MYNLIIKFLREIPISNWDKVREGRERVEIRELQIHIDNDKRDGSER